MEKSNSNVESSTQYKQRLQNLPSDLSIVGGTKPTEIINCLKQQKWDEAKTLLQKGGISINRRDAEGQTALIYATKGSNTEIVKQILDFPFYANPNMADSDQNTCLLYACAVENSEIVEMLLQKGAYYGIKNKDKMTPEDMATNDKIIEAIKLHKYHIQAFVKEDLPENEQAVAKAIAEGNLNEVKRALEKVEDQKGLLNKGITRAGESVLHFAIAVSEPEIAIFLIEKGANVNFQDANGATPLHLLCEQGAGNHRNLIDKLIEKGADFCIKDSTGDTPLTVFAKWAYDYFSMEFLCNTCWKYKNTSLGKSWLIKDDQNKTIFQYQIEKRNVVSMELMLKNGANPFEIRDHQGELLIFDLIATKKISAIQKALEKKKSIGEIMNKKGESLLHFAVKSGCSPNILECILKKGVNALLQDKEGNTVFHSAALAKNIEQLRCLLHPRNAYNGFERVLQIKNKKGQTIRDICAQIDSISITALLENYNLLVLKIKESFSDIFENHEDFGDDLSAIYSHLWKTQDFQNLKKVKQLLSPFCPKLFIDVCTKRNNLSDRIVGHCGQVTCVQWSSDCRKILSASEDKTIKIWDIEKRRNILTIDAGEKINSVRFSPDETKILAGGASKVVKIYNVKDGSKFRFLKGHEGAITVIRWYTDDASQVVSASEDKTIKFWDIAKEECTKTIECSSAEIQTLELSPDRTKLAFSGNDCIVRIWDLKQDEQTHEFKGHTLPIQSLYWARDNGAQLTSVGLDEGIKTWKLADGKCSGNVITAHDMQINVIRYNPQEEEFFTTGDDGVIKIWKSIHGGLTIDLEYRDDEYERKGILSAEWSVDGKQIVAGYSDGVVRIWDVQERKVIQRFQGHISELDSVYLSTDGTRVAVIEKNSRGSFSIWDTMNCICLYSVAAFEKVSISTLIWSQDSERIAGFGGGNKVGVWDARNGKQVYKAYEYDAFVDDPEAGEKKTAEAEEQSQQQKLEDGDQTSHKADESLHMSHIQISKSQLEEKQIEEKPTPKIKETKQFEQILKIELANDGSKIAVGNHERIVIVDLQNLENEAIVISVEGLKVKSLTWSPDATMIASLDKYNTITIWDVASLKCLHTLDLYEVRAFSIQWTLDGSKIVVGFIDKVIQLWDALNGQCLGTFNHGEGEQPAEDPKYAIGRRIKYGSIMYKDFECETIQFFGHPVQFKNSQAGLLKRAAFNLEVADWAENMEDLVCCAIAQKKERIACHLILGTKGLDKEYQDRDGKSFKELADEKSLYKVIDCLEVPNKKNYRMIGEEEEEEEEKEEPEEPEEDPLNATQAIQERKRTECCEIF